MIGRLVAAVVFLAANTAACVACWIWIAVRLHLIRRKTAR